MFDYSLAHWLTFFIAAVLLNLSPGPDMAFILGQTARGGRRCGYTAMLGGWCGTGVHVLMAALGLSAILATSALAFSLVKWVGAAYLIWLGIQALRSAGSAWQFESGIRPAGHRAVFRQGVLVAVLNPKVAIFFLAFLPQFVVPGAGPAPAQLFLHGCLIIVVAGLVEPPLVHLGAWLSGALRRSPRLGAWLERGLGVTLIGLGTRLALSGRD
ncbi:MULTISPECIES: LysE family translocator [unclassified Modicisalibacter]|uniref:LysE family translocator n=1 Tax=unclassified Modicisalibacter TaxID=2679913 RepID=UPI001CCEBDA1|nr:MULTISPECIES: LysE family translocator [unclassified Modicisalibacter]MBZ9559150.1 LysE family translocator [Modicisalibacter sp. R2A 31.J]MBZ9576685.1 LysE family translocator [Modicisalibacter sp. MOD 31.J]